MPESRAPRSIQTARDAYVSRGVSEKYIHFSDEQFYNRWVRCADKVVLCPFASGSQNRIWKQLFFKANFYQDAERTGTPFCNHLFLMLKTVEKYS